LLGVLVSVRGRLGGLSGLEKVVKVPRGGLLDDLRRAPAIPGSVLGR
jgi:hypothetical protein